ncbi:MAG: DUF4012 domain-containing protein [Actinobacteria bacterium]|nr:DUF4012 domain-containing protein [Actinomycetota bacterium]
MPEQRPTPAHGAVTDPLDPPPDAPPDPAATDETRSRRRGPLRLVAVAAAALLLAWIAFVTLRVVTAARSADRGVAAMQSARDVATGDLTSFIDSVGDPHSAPAREMDEDLAAATSAFEDAHAAVTSPFISPLRHLPVLGRQVESVAALSTAASTTTEATRRTFHELTAIASDPPTTPEGRVTAGRRTQTTLAAFESSVRGLDLGPDRGLLPPLADAYNRFARESAHLDDTIGRALTAVTGLNRFIGGPTRYLVLAANNAEMRAGSGMFLQAGELTVDAGRFTLSEMQPTERMVLPGAGATLDPDVARLWDWAFPNREWRALNMTPRFDESARMASEMWTAGGHGPVDGVIALDVLGLKRLLRLVGPVQVAGPGGDVVTITADDVVEQLLIEQYRDAQLDNADRRDRLSQVASAVFDAMNHQRFSPGQLLRALQRSGSGRHLLVWSRDPVEQAGWSALGATGTLDGQSMLLSLMNRGGNKLDQFVSITAAMSWKADGKVRHVAVEVDMANGTPPGLPRYIVGPYPGIGTVAGEYKGVLALTVPRSAGNASSEGAELFRSGDDGPTRLVAAKVDLQAGTSTRVTFRFDVPIEQRRIVVQPSARIPPVTWHAGGDEWTDDGPRTVQLTR